MSSTIALATTSNDDRLSEAIRRSQPFLSSDAQAAVNSIRQPDTLGIVAGTLAIWAASHTFGVGEIVDVVLLGVGVVALGLSVFEGASELRDFATGALGARSDTDMESAGKHFAHAVTLLGISALQTVLLRGQGRAIVARGRPQDYPRLFVGYPPPSGNHLRITRPAKLVGGSLGETTAYGEISIARNQTLSEQRVTLFHELVHRYFSPRIGPFRKLRAELNMSAYSRSALLRYLEEAFAEGYSQLRVHGLTKALGAIKFPLEGSYVTVSELASEGLAIGTIALGGTLFRVTISLGKICSHD
jgi:hypothetical protein